MSSSSSSSSAAAVRRKIVVVGDGACGKSSLLQVYEKGSFPTAYEPTIFETGIKDMSVRGQDVEIALWDTAGQEGLDSLRPLSYPDADVVLICYAVDDPTSFENVTERWLPEVERHCNTNTNTNTAKAKNRRRARGEQATRTHVVLVGCKTDVRKDKDALRALAEARESPVCTAQGEALAKKTGALFAECSAMHNDNVEAIFYMAAEATLKPRTRPRKNRWICR